MESSFNQVTGLLDLTTASTGGIPPILNLTALTDILVNQSVYIQNYAITTVNSRSVNKPIIDGIALNSGRAGSTIRVATGRDYKYTTSQSLGTSGTNLYLSSDAIISTTLPSLVNGDKWYVPLGRRLNEFDFLYDPQTPILLDTLPNQNNLPSPYPTAVQDKVVLGEPMATLTAFRIKLNGDAFIVTCDDDELPIIDGITLESGGISSNVLVGRNNVQRMAFRALAHKQRNINHIRRKCFW